MNDVNWPRFRHRLKAFLFAAHKFAVESKPLIKEVLGSPFLANCDGCGYPGCEGYAIEVVPHPDVPPNLCFPGKEAVAEKVATLTGKKMAAMEYDFSNRLKLLSR